MPGSAQSDDSVSSEPHNPSHDPTALGERELEAALQLLVERAQYITGATGTALALPQGDEMVCRASAGACAPAVGARLQVRSGLTGESIARRQLLRCDNAETDPRVNLETCRALGIASIVVLPLLRQTGEVRGLFELFSDHPYAFEERDLVALERMAALTLTALDLAEQRHDAVAPTAPPAKQTKAAGPAIALTANAASTTYSPKETHSPLSSPVDTQGDLRGVSVAGESATVHQSKSVHSKSAEPGSTQALESSAATSAMAGETSTLVNAPVVESARSFSSAVVSPPMTSASVISAPPVPAMSAAVIEPPPPDPAPVPEAMRRVQKCASCGFPVSEGRALCLDCESLEHLKVESEKKAPEKAAREVGETEAAGVQSESVGTRTGEQDRDDSISSVIKKEDDAAGSSAAAAQDEILPPFLTNPLLVKEPWLARHVNLLAFLVLVAAVLVAAVVFFR